MKKLSSYFAFFLMGIGASYFFANHKIVENKKLFTEEIEILSEKYNAREISFNELQKQNQELSGKIFQLLFTYFGIDIREMELNSINEAKEVTSTETKLVEKIIYIEKNAPLVKKSIEKKDSARNKKKKWDGSIISINLTEFLEDALPVRVKSNEFELLGKKYKKLKAIKKNRQVHTIEFDLSYTKKKKSYQGTYKINYSLTSKKDNTLTLTGTPTIFITNYKYPGLIGVWINSDRLALVNTMSEFKINGPRGIVFLRDKFSTFSRETTLFTKKAF